MEKVINFVSSLSFILPQLKLLTPVFSFILSIMGIYASLLAIKKIRLEINKNQSSNNEVGGFIVEPTLDEIIRFGGNMQKYYNSKRDRDRDRDRLHNVSFSPDNIFIYLLWLLFLSTWSIGNIISKFNLRTHIKLKILIVLRLLMQRLSLFLFRISLIASFFFIFLHALNIEIAWLLLIFLAIGCSLSYFVPKLLGSRVSNPYRTQFWHSRKFGRKYRGFPPI